MRSPTKPTPPAKLETWQLIIRIGHPSSPDDQRACMAELWRHGCWIGEGQPGRDAWEAYVAERQATAP